MGLGTARQTLKAAMATPRPHGEADAAGAQDAADALDVCETPGHSDLPNGLIHTTLAGEDGGGKPQGFLCGLRKGIRKHRDYVRIPVPDPKTDHLPLEWWKTGVAFIYACFNLVLTTVVITVVHERVPDKETSPPLPDKFFDYIDRVSWAFTVTEVNGMILLGLWFMQWLFLKYRAIAGRRFFFLMGTLYLYRCVTMYITTLPVPGKHMTCAPKLYGDSQAKVHRILQLISGGGLSMASSDLMCGDFLYSGHTLMLTLTYLFIKEYSPRTFWLYHVVCWLLSIVGVVCILVAHEHYSVDVVVAYFITSRLFYWYHTMANVQELRNSPHNYLKNTWWGHVFNFFEKNIQTQVPCTFCWPIPWPPSCFKNSCKRYTAVQSAREE
ncbi:phosphatidylcholine:ceramide cholinephosphotransferase 2-like [Conger conger]|uniref:phosphatidylcholine:ceramide cholinephosphotransferase 2-like n=1 Tax=Conger conger TaxID=82655 RepID=UPI002A5983D4|nr:phosphatidylcholine:ceramide cholinephosphotransferase 2-like [Conger conger]XP_061106786.1 phosphatidylcholine:ceramide cholinephosphotransferase 2-like [Conger conger]XP_061106787.1 phosphatidylcholine:ceramide cholinephosphotransferase 2-like [Conger conger]